MPAESPDVIVIGAGLSGLACALELHEAGRKVIILEAADGPGGRVRTDEVDGFLLDHGFQVYLDAYPTAGRLLDLPKLDLQSFEPGAFVFSGGKLNRVMDVFRRPRHLLASAFAPIGSLFDKMRVAKLRFHLKGLSLAEIAKMEDLSTQDFLKRFGFSDHIIDGFFRSFYGGIFLENELRTSSRMFAFTFKMFTEGSATLPAKGMSEIPKQLAARLPEDQVQYNCTVTNIEGNKVRLAHGQTLSATQIVVATPANVTQTLFPDFPFPKLKWRSVTTLYFSAPKSPLHEATLALNGESRGLINNVAILTDLCSAYAPAGKALVSVSVLGLPDEDKLASNVIQELTSWFGNEASQWQHLRTYRIPHALPEQIPNPPATPVLDPPYYLCGDYRTSASIEGAIISGQDTARQILAN